MNIDEYLTEIVKPSFLDFQSNPNSLRYAYIACVTLTHVADHITSSLADAKEKRDEWCNLDQSFLIVDEVAQYLKHGERTWVKKKKINKPGELLITHAIGLEKHGITTEDLHSLYFNLRDALDFVLNQLGKIK